MDSPRDYYAILGVDADASRETIRKEFRKQLLEVHPDKCAQPTDPERLSLVMEAFDVLSDEDRRERYDRAWKIRFGERELDPEGQIPHVTESQKPQNRARAILYMLMNARQAEAIQRLSELDQMAVPYLKNYLETEEFIDASFLLAEYFQGLGEPVRALEWYQQVLQSEEGRRRHRPCYSEALERAKRLLVHSMSPKADPRVALEYLRRAEKIGLDKGETLDVLKRRAQCYLAMDMKNEAAKHLGEALEIQPNLKGIQRLVEALDGYL